MVAGVAILAGADGATASRLGASMTLLQGSIGALNDVIDAPHDAGHKPGKPIPAGLVSPGVARGAVVGGGGLGILLAIASGPAAGFLAVVVLAIGYAYDVAFKGTAWSWLPFALGIPLLPVFGWLGATGAVAPAFALLIPVAFVAGAALAIANARADLEPDAAAGVDSVAVRLGLWRSWVVHVLLLGLVVVAAMVTLVAARAPAATLVGATGAAVIVGFGAWLGRGVERGRRERGWEAEAIGMALLATAWLAGMGLQA